jgi:hypothetical protein
LKRFVLAAWVAAVAGTPAAGQMVSSASPQSVVKALQAAGYKAELAADTGGDPMIRSSAAGAKFTIFFFGCEKNVDCGEIQFYAGWTDKPSLEQINEWNRKHRFGRAYLDEKGEVNVEYDVNLELGGISEALFRNDLELWDGLMGDFQNYIADLGKKKEG